MQPDEANKCPSVLRKSVSWEIFSAFWLEQLVLVEEFLREDKLNLNTAQSFF